MAIRIAWVMVSAREPTEVPMALATSLAPMPQAMKKPNRQARARNSVPCWATISMTRFLFGHQDLQAVAHSFRFVRQRAHQRQHAVVEHHVDRRQFALHPE